MFKRINYKKQSILQNILMSLLVIIVLFTVSVLFLFYHSNKLVIADEASGNYGGWFYNNSFGWASESCNNLYGSDYEDFCGLDINPLLDVNFDGDSIDLDENVVKDNSKNDFTGRLFNFTKIDIRNGGKNKTTGVAEKKSNFNNSLYFNGNSYISFGDDSGLNISDGDFTASIWFKADAGLTETVFLLSNGKEANQRYHCWLDTNYHLSCSVKNKTIKASDIIEPDKWYNVAIVKATTIFSMYINGVLVGSESVGLGSTSPAEVILGADGDHLHNFQGELDEFRLFKQALNNAQILHNDKHNANYLLNINNSSGEMNGWVWSQGIGWICIGSTCKGTTPDGSASATKLHWTAQGNNVYPHMITGWADAIAFDNPGQAQYKNKGWISFQGQEILPANYSQYSNCVSCSPRDEESGLVLYLKMDEDTGTVAIDASGFNNNGFLNNFDESAWTADGRVNNCLNFDGKNDFVQIKIVDNPELDIVNKDFTIETWVKNNQNNDNDHLPIISAYGEKEWELYFDHKSNVLKFDIFGETIKSSVVDLSDWSHIVITADRDGDLIMYVNDEEVVRKDIAEYVNKYIKNKVLDIGANEAGNFWDDKIDIVRLYTRVLNRNEVSYNYNFPEKRFCSACLEQKTSPATHNACYQCERCRLKSGETFCEACASCRRYGLVFDSNTASIKGFAWGGNSVDGMGLEWLEFSPRAGSAYYRSYVSSKYGNIYSKANVGSDYTVAPPTNYFNATYMIQANGHIINWISGHYESDNAWHMSADSGDALNYAYPKSKNDYTNALGNLDYNGLTKGVYGEVIDSFPDASGGNYNVCLKNLIYFVDGDYVLEEKSGGIARNFENCFSAAGTIIINGDLTIRANVQYDASNFSGNSDSLASVAWIIKGDLIIEPKVEKLAGTFIVLGKDNVDCVHKVDSSTPHCGAVFTCRGDQSECGRQLNVSGQFLAKDFHFQRTFRSLESELREASENIIYDGRNVINPPPGLGDVLKVLPTWNQIAPY